MLKCYGPDANTATPQHRPPPAHSLRQFANCHNGGMKSLPLLWIALFTALGQLVGIGCRRNEDGLSAEDSIRILPANSKPVIAVPVFRGIRCVSATERDAPYGVKIRRYRYTHKADFFKELSRLRKLLTTKLGWKEIRISGEPEEYAFERKPKGETIRRQSIHFMSGKWTPKKGVPSEVLEDSTPGWVRFNYIEVYHRPK